MPLKIQKDSHAATSMWISVKLQNRYWEKDSSASDMYKIATASLFYTKKKSKWVRDLNVRPETEIPSRKQYSGNAPI